METEKRKQYWTYRILGSIDNFIAVLFLFLVIVSFMAAGFDPKLLFALFIWFSVLLYTNLSAVFGRHVMAKGNFLRYRLKEWIKVNAYVTIVYAIIVLGLMGFALIKRSVVAEISHVTTIPELWLYNVIFIFIGCMILLIIHVLLTFHYLKKFEDRFKDPEEPDQSMY